MRQTSLALATSSIHRSRSLEELKHAYLQVLPKFVDADAFGMYLFDDKLQTRTVCTYRANQHFLKEYGHLRQEDPLFNFLQTQKRFTHSLEMFDSKEWSNKPLRDFLSRWGLEYTIEAPLIFDDELIGTLNMARKGSSYFSEESLHAARFLCNEIATAYQHIQEKEKLIEELDKLRSTSNPALELSPRAKQVMDLAVRGYSNRVIAQRMAISENTVRHHLKQIYRQLDVHNRAQLVQHACSL